MRGISLQGGHMANNAKGKGTKSTVRERDNGRVWSIELKRTHRQGTGLVTRAQTKTRRLLLQYTPHRLR